MLIPSRDSGFNHLHSSEITPRSVYEDRRQMLKLMAGGAAGAATIEQGDLIPLLT